MKSWLVEHFGMPDKMASLLFRFLEQNNGKFSKRAIEKEFKGVTEKDRIEIEKYFEGIMAPE